MHPLNNMNKDSFVFKQSACFLTIKKTAALSNDTVVYLLRIQLDLMIRQSHNFNVSKLAVF